MAKLIYSAITSLDGYIADEDGNFDWAMPNEELHAFVNDLERLVGTLWGAQTQPAGFTHPTPLELVQITIRSLFWSRS